jgi:hypothetical protein
MSFRQQIHGFLGLYLLRDVSNVVIEYLQCLPHMWCNPYLLPWRKDPLPHTLLYYPTQYAFNHTRSLAMCCRDTFGQGAANRWAITIESKENKSLNFSPGIALRKYSNRQCCCARKKWVCGISEYQVTNHYKPRFRCQQSTWRNCVYRKENGFYIRTYHFLIDSLNGFICLFLPDNSSQIFAIWTSKELGIERDFAQWTPQCHIYTDRTQLIRIRIDSDAGEIGNVLT